MCSLYDVVTQRSSYQNRGLPPLENSDFLPYEKSSYFCSLKRFPLYLGHQEIIF